MLHALIVTALIAWNGALLDARPTQPTAQPAIADLFAELRVDPTVNPLDRLLRTVEDLTLMDSSSTTIDLSKHVSNCVVVGVQCLCLLPEGCVEVQLPHSCRSFGLDLDLCPEALCRISCD